MRFVAILNRESGTLRTTELDGFRQHLQQAFARHGHTVDCRLCDGRALTRALEQAFADDCDGVIAGGGDGTISAAGGMAWRSGKVLGVLPAGTMNLYARTLGIPLEVWNAAEALAGAEETRGDIATANNHPYLHQFSVGFHPRMVRSRDRRHFSSRFTKIFASIAAIVETLRRPPRFPVEIDCQGEKWSQNVSALMVSNNPYGEGHLPYADQIATGRLGLYVTGPLTSGAGARLAADLTLGTWRDNPDMSERLATAVALEFPRRRQGRKAVIDGELVDLADRVELRCHPRELRVLRPRQTAQT